MLLERKANFTSKGKNINVYINRFQFVDIPTFCFSGDSIDFFRHRNHERSQLQIFIGIHFTFRIRF